MNADPDPGPFRVHPNQRYFVRTDFVSEGIRSAAYDEAARTLDIEFPNDTYRYFQVLPAEFEAFFDAQSKGEYVNRHIKPHYRYEKLARGGGLPR